MQEIRERDEERALMNQYTVAPSRQLERERTSREAHSGFQVQGAPWSLNEQEFPTMGAAQRSSGSTPSWGPRRR